MESTEKPILITITGPTGVGKTTVAIQVARHFNCEIISADSRQFYHGVSIGTALPTSAQLEAIKHHFVAFLNLETKYDVFQYEQDAIPVLKNLFSNNRYAILTGGSGHYIQAIEKGLDELPGTDDRIHNFLIDTYREKGLTPLREMLMELDPEYYCFVDLENPKRIVRALNVCMATGKTFSSFRKNQPAPRLFRTIKIALNLPRNELHDRINARVDQMITNGLVEEARRVYPLNHVNALNTIGYKELFQHFDGEMSLDEAIAKIKTNTRRYARRQITWLRREPEVIWCEPDYLLVIAAIEYAIKTDL